MLKIESNIPFPTRKYGVRGEVAITALALQVGQSFLVKNCASTTVFGKGLNTAKKHKPYVFTTQTRGHDCRVWRSR